MSLRAGGNTILPLFVLLSRKVTLNIRLALNQGPQSTPVSQSVAELTLLINNELIFGVKQ